MIFNVTDIELDEEQNSYKTSRPNVLAYISVGNKFIDAVWRSSIEIPLTSSDDIIQIIIKENDANEKKLGSVSIPTYWFNQLEKKRTYSHWVTLFDYIEDDEYDGDLGIDDEEVPRAYIRYSIEGQTEAKSPKIKKTKTAFEEKSTRLITTTKQATHTISYGSRLVKQTEPEPERLKVVAEPIERIESPQKQPSQSNVERYTVRVLEGDLKADTKELLHELQDQQVDLFNQEEFRIKTIAQLDKLHKELTGEHIQDQITGYQITRNQQDIFIEFEVRRAAIVEEKTVLNHQIEEIELETQQTKQIGDTKARMNNQLHNEVDKDERIDTKGLSEEAKDLRKGNDALRKQANDNNNALSKEARETQNCKEKHDQAIKDYNDQIDKFNSLILSIEQDRREADQEVNILKAELFKEEVASLELSKKKDHTDRFVSSLSGSANRLKNQLQNLESRYTDSIGNLMKETKQQERDIEELQNSLYADGESVRELSTELKNHSNTIQILHKDVDKENATNSNSVLRKLFDELILVDRKRMESQENLEWAHKSWSVKTKIFQNNASRRSRETAREKRMQEVDKVISKIDQNSKDFNNIKAQLEKVDQKLFTDTHRDILEAEFKRELEGTRLKVRWAEDERRASYEELQRLLTIMKENDTREMQEAEIQELQVQIDEVRVQVNQLDTHVQELFIEVNTIKEKIQEVKRMSKEAKEEILTNKKNLKSLSAHPVLNPKKKGRRKNY